MKRLAFYVAIAFVISIFPRIQLALAQESLPQVPVTYPGDTAETIARRAKWIEGARKEGKLEWWGVLNPSEATAIIKEFKKIYPFIEVNFWRGRGEETGTKVEGDFTGGRYSVDVILGGDYYNYPRWSKMGVMETFIDMIPGIETFDRRRYSKRGDWVMPAFAPKIPQYNTKLLPTRELPKNWEDLLDPKWKGQMGAEVDPEDWVDFALAEGGWGIEKMEAFLMKLKEQKPRFIRGGSAAHSLLIAGEFKILAMGNLRHVLGSQMKRAPVDWIRVRPILVTGPPFVMPKRAPHPNATRLFFEWIFSPPGLQLWAEISQNYVPGVSTPIAKHLEGVPLVITDETVKVRGAELGLVKRFNEVLLGVEH